MTGLVAFYFWTSSIKFNPVCLANFFLGQLSLIAELMDWIWWNLIEFFWNSFWSFWFPTLGQLSCAFGIAKEILHFVPWLPCKILYIAPCPPPPPPPPPPQRIPSKSNVALACRQAYNIAVMHQSIPAAPIPPPRQLRGICTYCQSRGSGISLPKGYPRAFDTHVVSDSKSKRRRFYRKRLVVCHWLACLSRTGPNCGGF